MENAEIILDAMKKAGKALKAAEVAELTGLAKADVDKVFKTLKKEGRIESPKVCFYQPVKK